MNVIPDLTAAVGGAAPGPRWLLPSDRHLLLGSETFSRLGFLVFDIYPPSDLVPIGMQGSFRWQLLPSPVATMDSCCQFHSHCIQKLKTENLSHTLVCNLFIFWRLEAWIVSIFNPKPGTITGFQGDAHGCSWRNRRRSAVGFIFPVYTRNCSSHSARSLRGNIKLLK